VDKKCIAYGRVPNTARTKEEIEALYNELLFHVGNKFPGETRHQTALRYIKNAEIGSNVAARSILARDGVGG
jgi:hypothetical protein